MTSLCNGSHSETSLSVSPSLAVLCHNPSYVAALRGREGERESAVGSFAWWLSCGHYSAEPCRGHSVGLVPAAVASLVSCGFDRLSPSSRGHAWADRLPL